MMEQTPEQKKAGERMRQRQERTERQFREFMLDLAIRTHSWKCCPFSDCRRARHCQSKQFSERDEASWREVTHGVRQLSQSIMPACTALAWYEGLQDIVLDDMRARVAAGPD